MKDEEILEMLNAVAGNRTINSSDVSITINDGEPENVYCVSVPSSAFVVKQNGCVSVTGNCHIDGLIKLFRIMIKENKKLWNDETKKSIYDLAEKMMELEYGFIDYVYDQYDEIFGLGREEVKQYIKYIIDRRLISMGMKGINKVKKNPLPWVDEMIASQNHENFFETRSTSYAKGSLKGTWMDVWGKS